MSNDPVAQLDKIFVENLGEDWELLECPEEVVLGVSRGTVVSLLREIKEKNLWTSLAATAARHSEQWMIDLSSFFPHEEAFVEPLVAFLMMAKGEHARVCLAQEADEWAWGPNSTQLLPNVIECVRQTRMDVCGGNSEPTIPVLDRVINRLSELANNQ